MIGWQRHAEEFLRLHGWAQDDDDWWHHPAFPLAEPEALGIVKGLYGRAWEAYMAVIGITATHKSHEDEED